MRRELEQRRQAYVLAVTSAFLVNYFDARGFQQKRVRSIFKRLGKRAWKRLSAGAGSKGERLYDWAYVRYNEIGVGSPLSRERAKAEGFDHGLLARRTFAEPREITYCRAYDPLDVTLEQLVRAAGSHWRVEVCFEALKQKAGLDQSETRS